MEIALKQRLLGAILLIFLGVLVIPMLLDTRRPDLVQPLPEVADPKELTFTYEALPIDPDAHVAPGPGVQEPLSLEPREKWYVQVGRFRNASGASKIRDAMREAGYPTNLFADQSADGKTDQRVWVGPYYSQREAEYALEGIKAKKSLTNAEEGWVVRRP